MRFYLPIIFLLLLHSVQSGEFKFQFHVYRAEPAIGRALEDRLITGGDAAKAAMDKLPDFVRQKRVSDLASVSLSVKSGERQRKTSGDSLITLPAHEAVDGLEIEVDVVSDEGNIEFSYYGAYTSKEKDKPVERTVASLTRGTTEIPMLLCRWQMEKDWLLLVATANGTAVPKSAAATDELVYIESAYYPSATSASAGRDLLASTRIPCLTGQKGRVDMIAWIDDENILDTDQPGFRTVLDPDSNGDGSIKLSAKCSYIVEAGGRTRLESGERVRRLKIREVTDTLEMKEGVLAGRKSKLAAIEDIETKEDNYVAAFKFVRAK